MAGPKLPPVPPLTAAGFQDPVWMRWLSLLRESIGENTVTIAVASANGFTGSVSTAGGVSTITLGTSVTGLLKGQGGAIVPASPGGDYVVSVVGTAPIAVNTSGGGVATVSHNASGVTAGSYSKVTVNALGHVTAGGSITSGDVTTALGYTPLNPANNLSDVSNIATARANLGLGTLATQNANAIAVTGGTLAGVTITTSSFSGTVTVTGGSITGTTINNSAIGAATPSTGAFTNLSASGTVSGVGFSNYLASPPAIGTTTPAAGQFTTLKTTANALVIANNTTTQSIPTGATGAVITNWTGIVDRSTSFNATTGVFTAPRTGYYAISATLSMNALNAGARAQLWVYVNGSAGRGRAEYVNPGGTQQINPMISANFALTAGDLITIVLLHNATAAVTLTGAAGLSHLSIAEIP